MNNSVRVHVGDELCTGCGACQNICPFDAIEMKENDEGFIVPNINPELCTNCGKCTTVCPKLSYEKINSYNPPIYAVRAEDSIRKVSSSGGVFTVIAKWILEKKGVVCGAAFNESNELHHVCIEREEELDKLRGSKYLQSNIGLIYRKIEQYLVEGRYVLFTGCPCQVVGLKKYLHKDYDNLYLIDILCHGVPSQKIFTRYLNEKFGDERVTDVKFRDKVAGWNATWIHVFFDNQKSYLKDYNTDIYEKIFQKNVLLRKVCSDCNFCEFPRVGDISMGDFWGISAIDKSQNDGKGTSIVFNNNGKGGLLLEVLKKECVVKQIEVDTTKIRNRIHAKYPAHPARDRFAQLIKNYTLEEAYDIIQKTKFDIGLVGIYTVENFGGALTYFALYHTLQDLGYSVYMIERPKNAKHKPASLSKIYEKAPYPPYTCASIYETKEQMKDLNKNCSSFVIGSDQLFNNLLYHNFGQWCTLDWVNDNKNKIAYAASFGHDIFRGTDETRATMSYFMKKFNAFSVREKSGVDLAKKEFGVNAEWVLDPVFLCDEKHYLELADHVESSKTEPYIGGYILDPSGDKKKILKFISEKMHLPLKIYSEMFIRRKHDAGWDLEINDGKIEERLKNIIESDFFVADSFHGVCFAIIFKKNFIAILNKKRGASRFISILSELGLEDRMVEDFSQLANNDKIFSEIDYDAVYRILNRERRRCKYWLLSNLEKVEKKPYSTYDILIKDIRNMQAEIRELKQENSYLMRYSSALIKEGDATNFICNINNIEEYLYALDKNLENYTIFIAVKDTAGYFVTNSMYAKLKKIGCKANLQKMHWYSYIAVIDDGKMIFEKADKEKPLKYIQKVNGVEVSIISKGLPLGNLAQIIIDKKDYSVNKRGLNIVVYDKEKKQVIDSVCFDTHTMEATAYRKNIND